MLRNGDVWADHARSVRPYVRHDPGGLGLAGAYAACLLQSRLASMNSPVVPAAPLNGGRRLSNAIALARIMHGFGSFGSALGFWGILGEVEAVPVYCGKAVVMRFEG
jgi:hypothetical protein